MSGSGTEAEPAVGVETGGSDGDAADDRVVVVRKHTLARRWMHWINFPLLLIMLWSGLRIYNASDTHAIDVLGLRFDFFPQPVFDFFEADRKLAKGIAFHLTFGWLFVLNAVVYLAYLVFRGGWREIVPDRRTLRNLPATVAHDLGLRGKAPPHGKYNAAQRFAYTGVIVMGAVMVLTGFAIYKPTQLRELTWLLGGYETARLVHFGTALGLVGFFLVHLVQVARAGWRNFASMITGMERVDDRPDRESESAGDEGVAP